MLQVCWLSSTTPCSIVWAGELHAPGMLGLSSMTPCSIVWANSQLNIILFIVNFTICINNITHIYIRYKLNPEQDLSEDAQRRRDKQVRGSGRRSSRRFVIPSAGAGLPHVPREGRGRAVLRGGGAVVHQSTSVHAGLGGSV